jgi:hypothetical protein
MARDLFTQYYGSRSGGANYLYKEALIMDECLVFSVIRCRLSVLGLFMGLYVYATERSPVLTKGESGGLFITDNPQPIAHFTVVFFHYFSYLAVIKLEGGCIQACWCPACFHICFTENIRMAPRFERAGA